MPEAQSQSDAQPAASPMLKIKIVEQIEYYFGDFNLNKDKFLKTEIQKDAGWVDLKTLLRFNRLAALTKDEKVILSAFEENPSSLVEVDAEEKRIRRKPERVLPEPDEAWRSSVAQRTVYVKGFPLETTSLEDILKFMETFGKVDNVYKRNYRDKALKEWKFKGSVYVSFPTVEEAERFVSIKSVKFSGNELIRKMQLDYVEEKKNERLEFKLKTKKRKDELLKEQEEEIKKEMKKLPTGALIQLTGLTEAINRTVLKDTVIKLGWDVAFVDYVIGETTAYVRLQEQDSAKEAVELLTNNSFDVNGVSVKAEIVEGEQEETLLKKMENDKNDRVLQNFMKTRKGKKFNKGKKQFKQDNSNSEKKTENNEAAAKESNGAETGESSMAVDESSSNKRKSEAEVAGESSKKSKPEDN